ncbi:hypothetical protein EDB87DRAFT_4140 [Lactarius vividus]|nr:hypothetical protein EDB87DRAFT_4140 [Lactarius vividus]
MGGSQGLGQDRDLVSGRERVLTRGPPRAPVPAPLLVQGLAPGHGHDRGRATGELVTENAPAGLVPEAGPRVVAEVAAGNASVEEREVVRRIERRENDGKMGRYRLRWAASGVNMGSLPNLKAEFRTWLVEERKMNPEKMSKDQNKKEFARFVEDYNTATFPNEKFYNIEAYERRMNAMRAGEFVPPPDETYDAEADMRAHQSSLKRPAVESESYLDKDQLQELRRVQRERVEVGKMKLLGMDVKANMGVRMDVVDG